MSMKNATMFMTTIDNNPQVTYGYIALAKRLYNKGIIIDEIGDDDEVLDIRGRAGGIAFPTVHFCSRRNAHAKSYLVNPS